MAPIPLMTRGRLLPVTAATATVDGPNRTSGRGSAPGYPIDHHVAGPTGPSTKISLGARGRATTVSTPPHLIQAVIPMS
jgi:hypothetical protein